MVDLPAQVKAQAAELAAFDAQVLADQTPPETPEGDTPATPGEEQAPPAAVEPPPVAVDWEQKFKSLEGKYRSEVPALTSQIKTLSTTVEELKTQKPAEEPKPAQPQQTSLTAKDTDDFGPELIDLIQRGATDVFAKAQAGLLAQIEGLKAEIAKVQEHLGGVADTLVMSAREKFEADLKSKHGDIYALNADPRFLAWCDTINPGTGLTFQHFITEAFRDADFDRADELLTIATKGWTTPAQPLANGHDKPELEEMLSPPRSPSRPDPDVAAEERVFTEAEVAEIYRDMSKGKYTAPEKKALEAEIDRAVAGNRVRG